MKARSRSIFYTIFISFFLVLMLFLVTFCVFYYNDESKQMKSLMFSMLTTRAEDISETLDQKINQMEMVSAELAASKEIANGLDYLAGASKGSIESPVFYERDGTVTQLREKLLSYTGSRKGADQINVYLKNGAEISSGLNNELRMISGEKLQKLSQMENGSGSRYVYFSGFNEELSRYYLSDIGKYFITFLYEDQNAGGKDGALVEIQKSIFQVIGSVVYYQPIYEENIYLFDKFGNQIYPLKQDGGYAPYFEAVQATGQDAELLFQNPETGREEYLIYNYSPYTGFYTVFAMDRQRLVFSIYNNFLQFLPFVIVILGVAVILSLMIARFLSRPINRIYRYVKETDFGSPDMRALPEIQTSVVELNTLTKAFKLLQTKLREGNDRQLVLQQQEMQSKMLSLQSQMNPHFLYNSLATIQAMAEEDMTDEIVIMCQTTSRILRYISSDKERMVPLRDEIAHTHDFLQCMYIRYDGDLSYEVHIPREMEEILIPKLCVQLLVENSVKFTTQTKPPWHISIMGTVDNRGDEKIWLLSVKDNGPGFTKEKQEEIYDKIAQIDATNLLPSLELKGMGLLNIYIRLKFSYKDQFIFYIKNTAPRGCEIIIGGKYE
ncbi:sensor histidine kinase [Christensenella tenuis]|uniref:Histidine kinase n=1 Tax=Christensenella tenuis TaxID=2763033 RepID=A0ABR7EHE2_9FIRM|nr:histidine kinase [Christensenella tenuis]MBC5648459.1 histidine kinase [Christensenella tenuis]